MLGPSFAVNVVVVDADAKRANRLASELRDLGFGATSAGSGIAGVEQALDEACDALVVTEPLPDMALRQFVTMIRAVGEIPIVAVVTGSRGVVGALDAGADDAVTAPASPDEIDARMRAVRQRSRAAESADAEVLHVGELMIDRAAREARVAGREVALSRKEFDLLVALAKRPNQVVSKSELMAEVWDRPDAGPDQTVDVHLSWLRRKLGETASEPRYLRTVRGVGVKIVDPGG